MSWYDELYVGDVDVSVRQDDAKLTLELNWGEYGPRDFNKLQAAKTIAQSIKKLWFAGEVLVFEDEIIVYIRSKAGWRAKDKVPGKGTRMRLRRTVRNRMISALRRTHAVPYAKQRSRMLEAA